MVKRIGRRFVSLLLTFVTILTLLPAMTLPALAATSGTVTGLADDSIGLSFSGGADNAWSASGTQIIGTATSTSGTCGNTDYNSTLKITNKKSTTATLSFDYTIEQNSGEIQVDGTKVSSGDSYTKKLEANESVTVYIKSGSTSAATKITLTNVVLVSDVNATATFVLAENGTYTVDGQLITEEYRNTQSSKTAYQVAATPANGYQFLGWYNVTEEKYINTSPTAALYIENDCTITARFASKTAALFETGGQPFDDLGKAVVYAQEKHQDKITLASDGKITGNYTIPTGVTLLIPFDAKKSLYTDKPASVGTYQTPSVFRKLTMASGSSITVNGAISVGGEHCHTMGHLGPSGPYGQIDMAADSAIKLKNGANLYAWGFITGDGKITAASGSTVYEYFQLMDWRGGRATSGMLGNKYKVFPISQYYVQNIEAALTLQAGAHEHAYISVDASLVGTKSTSIDFIGSTNGLFRLAAGAEITKKYDPKTDRVTYTTTGSASLDSLALSVAGYNMNSKDYVLPVNSNMTLNILSGRVAVNCDAALLPGAQITIAQGAELYVLDKKSLYVYDQGQWKASYVYGSKDGFLSVPYSPSEKGNRTLTDAKIDVNGTLTAAGSVYTTESGANICSSEGGGRFVQQGTPGTANVTYQATQEGNKITDYPKITITAAKLKNADGVEPSYTQTKDAKAYDIFTYCKGQECKGKWVQNLKVAAIIDGNGAQVGTYATLQEAVDAYEPDDSTAPKNYIQMLHSTTGNVDTDKNLYLDLNGCTVTGDFTMKGKTLHGMDSATDKYDGTNAGKIVGAVSGYAKTYQTPTETTAEGETYDRYVAVLGMDADNKTPTLSFHRFNISVTGYRFELATGNMPQCALFFIGKFQGDDAAKKYLTSLGFTLKDNNDTLLGKANYEFTADTVISPMPNEGEEGTSEVVLSDDGAYFFEVYLMRSFDKGNRNSYTEKIGATAQATFKNGGTQNSGTKKWSFEDAWTDPAMVITPEQQAILDKFLKALNIPNP